MNSTCAPPSNVGKGERTVPDLVLWGATTSRTIRAHWALRELGLAYRCEPILPRTGETKTERFTAIAPRQKIPALVDGDFVVAESAAIVAYLSTTDRWVAGDRLRTVISSIMRRLSGLISVIGASRSRVGVKHPNPGRPNASNTPPPRTASRLSGLVQSIVRWKVDF